MTLDRQLQRALQPIDPPDGFADRVLARLGEQHGVLPVPRTQRFGRARRWVPLALAASLGVAVLGSAAWLEQQRQRQGAEASAQVRQALRITTQELNDIRARALDGGRVQGESR
jgi:hypothetical protein